MRISLWIALIALNLIWAANPIAAKTLLRHFHPDQVGWIRYSSAVLGLFIATPFLRWRKIPVWVRPPSLRVFGLVFLTGFFPFTLAPILTARGLAGTQPSEAALIVVLEPLWSVILARIFLKESISTLQKAAFAVATVGFLLLSYGADFGGKVVTGGQWPSHLLFNALLFFAQAAEAAYSIAGKPALRWLPPGSVFAQALFMGWLGLTLWVCMGIGFSPIFDLTFWGVYEFASALWLGALGSTFGYLLWAFALQKATVAALALTLFIQPVAGALFGMWIWGDVLTAWQWCGAIILLVGVALPLRRILHA